MTTASLTQGIRANTPTERSCRSNCTDVRLAKITAEIIRVCQNAILGGSFRKSLAERARCSLRTIDNWISRDRDIDFGHFLNVCKGPGGADCIEVLWQHLPEEEREQWFARQVLERRIAEAEAEIKKVRGEAIDRQLRMELNRR